jgi:hypothetical protein
LVPDRPSRTPAIAKSKSRREAARRSMGGMLSTDVQSLRMRGVEEPDIERHERNGLRELLLKRN